MNKRLAAIDFGTNTARLLIAELYENNTFEHLFLERRIVRMGGGFCRQHGLSADAIDRGLSCLKDFAVAIAQHDVSEVRAVATSAVRDAGNGVEFVAQVQKQTGIKLQVIDGLVEAELTMSGVLVGIDQQHDEIIIFDIGGGSTEFTYVKNGRALYSRSLPMGVVRLTEGKVTLEAMSDKIARELELLAADMRLSGVLPGPDALLVGTAGTATTLAAINLRMEEYDYRKVNNTMISLDEISSIFDRLYPLSLEERLKVVGLEKGREDLIIAGILITLLSMELFGKKSMTVSDYGLLEGLIVSGAVTGV
jgi:exopolyphosphatase / guanosine-5'-triphosphate,3'-diphosphate pyrophosphatase